MQQHKLSYTYLTNCTCCRELCENHFIMFSLQLCPHCASYSSKHVLFNFPFTVLPVISHSPSVKSSSHFLLISYPSSVFFQTFSLPFFTPAKERCRHLERGEGSQPSLSRQDPSLVELYKYGS